MSETTQFLVYGGIIYYQPYRDLLPALPPEEIEELREDIRAAGQVEVAIVAVELEPAADGQKRRRLIDGNNRLERAAEVGLPPEKVPVTLVPDRPPEEERARAVLLNVRRRQLTQQQKQALVLDLLKSGVSKAEAAKAAAVDVSTVGKMARRNRSAEEQEQAEQQAEQEQAALDERRRQVADLVAQGLSVRKIAAQLGSKPTTIQDDKAWLSAQAAPAPKKPPWEMPQPSFTDRMRQAATANEGRLLFEAHRTAFRACQEALGLKPAQFGSFNLTPKKDRDAWAKAAKAVGDDQGWVAGLIEDGLAMWGEPWQRLLSLEAEDRARRSELGDQVRDRIRALGLEGRTLDQVVEDLAPHPPEWWRDAGGFLSADVDFRWWASTVLVDLAGHPEWYRDLTERILDICDYAHRRGVTYVEAKSEVEGSNVARITSGRAGDKHLAQCVRRIWDELVEFGVLVELTRTVYHTRWTRALERGHRPPRYNARRRDWACGLVALSEQREQAIRAYLGQVALGSPDLEREENPGHVCDTDCTDAAHWPERPSVPWSGPIESNTSPTNPGLPPSGYDQPTAYARAVAIALRVRLGGFTLGVADRIDACLIDAFLEVGPPPVDPDVERLKAELREAQERADELAHLVREAPSWTAGDWATGDLVVVVGPDTLGGTNGRRGRLQAHCAAPSSWSVALEGGVPHECAILKTDYLRRVYAGAEEVWPRSCDHCHKGFTPEFEGQEFCSETCGLAFRQAQEPADAPEAPGPVEAMVAEGRERRLEDVKTRLIELKDLGKRKAVAQVREEFAGTRTTLKEIEGLWVILEAAGEVGQAKRARKKSGVA